MKENFQTLAKIEQFFDIGETDYVAVRSKYHRITKRLHCKILMTISILTLLAILIFGAYMVITKTYGININHIDK